MRLLTTLFAIFITTSSQGQHVFKMQTSIGAILPSFAFSDGSGNSVDYTTKTTSDIRFGFIFKNDTQSKIGFGAYTGVTNLSSESVNPNSSFELSVMNFDLFLNYTIESGIFHSLSIGPSVGFVTSQHQLNENQTVTNKGFANTHFGLYSELLFGKLELEKISANPYLFYRATLSNVEGADASSEKSRYSSVGLGIKISI